ncbi:MAG: acyl-CoA dehydrogenase [Micromonosporaceae bacterium]|nr:acyl-CoA dehydrogenase [Micromonosporaceae bacterium]
MPPTGDQANEQANEVEALRQAVREFAEHEVAPRVLDYNRRRELPWDLIAQMGELGFMGGTVPTEYGGLGLSYLSLVPLVEEMSRIDHVLAILMAQPSCSVGASIMLSGTEQQRRRYLPGLAAGTLLAAGAFTEPQSGSHLAGIETTYRVDGDGYLISGSKVFITLCDHAHVFLTLARDAADPATITAFLVDRDTPGLSSQAIPGTMGLHSIETGFLHLDQCPVPAGARLGEPGEGLAVAQRALDRGRLAVAARCLGMAGYCLDRSVDYASQRRVGGVAIGDRQLIQAKLAEVALGVETARALVAMLASGIDRGMTRLTYYSSLAKLHASEVAWQAANHALQIHGGYGYVDEYHIERYVRDARMYLIGEGTNEIHQVLVAQCLLGQRRTDTLPPGEWYRLLAAQ